MPRIPSWVPYCRAVPDERSTEEFIAAGLYDPATDAEIGRLELLRWLDAKGFTIDEMVEALATDSLGAMAGDRRVVPGERLTLAEAQRMSGISAESFGENVTAFGFVPIFGSPDGEVGITAEEAATMAQFDLLGSMFTPAEATSFLRVVGASIGRIADAAVSLFLADVESQSIASGESELELAMKVEDGIGLLEGFAASLDPVLRRHVLQAIERTRRTTISNTDRFQYRYAVGFVDLVGFTAISAQMEPRELATFLRDFEGRAYDVVTSEGARVVKLIGDEVMFVASEPANACRAANQLMEGFGEEHELVVPRGGVAYGEVLVRGGDYYGPVVNLASRLVDEAVPQELLVTEELASAASSCTFEPAGRRMVKGFADPVAVRSLVQ